MNISKLQIAKYLRDLCRQLELQARSVGFDTTAYLLGLVVEDMNNVISTTKKLPKRVAG